MEIAVFVYTDGSAGPGSPGQLGMGYHGFYYDVEKEYKKSADVPNEGFPTSVGYVNPNIVYDTDNAEVLKILTTTNLDNLKINPIGYLDGMFSVPNDKGYSNDAEVKAIEQALLRVGDLVESNSHILKRFVVYSDSKVALGIWGHVINIYRNHNELTKPENTEKLKEHIDTVYSKNADSTRNYILNMVPVLVDFMVKTNDSKLFFSKVKGHNGDIGNELADSLANQARKLALNGQMVNLFKWHTDRYWKPNVSKPNFLRFRQLYFINNTTNNIDADKAYFTVMNYGSIDIGKRSGDPLYGMIRMDTIPTEIVSVMERYHKEHSESPVLVYTIDLDKLYKPDFAKFFNAFGSDALSVHDHDLSIMGREPLAYPIKPAGLAKRVYDSTTGLIGRLETARAEVKDFQNGKGKFYFDITDLIYETKGKKLNCIIKPGSKTLDLTGFELDSKEFTVNTKLVLGTDIPDRNTLKAMESDEPKVYILFQREGIGVYGYYLFIFSEKTKTYGIYHNMFSNFIIFDIHKDKRNKK
jgi:ribonuclease H|nr:MAG TPA: RNAseH-like protein [Caudoviricetes sp.]